MGQVHQFQLPLLAPGLLPGTALALRLLPLLGHSQGECAGDSALFGWRWGARGLLVELYHGVAVGLLLLLGRVKTDEDAEVGDGEVDGTLGPVEIWNLDWALAEWLNSLKGSKVQPTPELIDLSADLSRQ